MSKNKILIVEDERITAEDLKNTLENLGYEVTGMASSADSFYKCLQSEMPDLVLMDIYLKGNKDGIELATEIKENYQLPVIYLTAYYDSNILERAKITEPFGYILKPFQEHELHSNIEMALYKNRMEKRVYHLNAILKAIRDVSQLIVRVDNTKDLLQKTCETLISSRAYSSAWFLILNQEGEYLDAASAGLSDNFDTSIIRFQKGFRPECFKFLKEKNEAVYSMNNSLDCKACSIFNLYPDNGTIISKVQYQNRLYGYLEVSMPHALVNDKEELALISEISNDLGLALNNLEQLKENAEAEEALHKSEILFRHAFDYAATSMCFIGLDGKFQKTNAAFVRLIEYPEEELKQMHFNDITHPEDLELGVDVMRKLIDSEIETASFEKRYLSKNKHTIYAFVSVSMLRDGLNQPKFFITHLIDLTQRKLYEENLKDSEEKYRTFMNSTSDIAYLKDDQLHYVMINKMQQEFLNKSVDEIIGKTDFELMPLEVATICHKTDQYVLENLKMAINTEASGDKIYETRKFPVRLKNDKTGVGAFIRNVTAQIAAEKAIQEKAAELERFNNLMVGRELKMIELKKEINVLLGTLGKNEKYKIVE